MECNLKREIKCEIECEIECDPLSHNAPQNGHRKQRIKRVKGGIADAAVEAMKQAIGKIS